jgi:hypothetical protein
MAPILRTRDGRRSGKPFKQKAERIVPVDEFFGSESIDPDWDTTGPVEDALGYRVPTNDESY